MLGVDGKQVADEQRPVKFFLRDLQFPGVLDDRQGEGHPLVAAAGVDDHSQEEDTGWEGWSVSAILDFARTTGLEEVAPLLALSSSSFAREISASVISPSTSSWRSARPPVTPSAAATSMPRAVMRIDKNDFVVLSLICH